MNKTYYKLYNKYNKNYINLILKNLKLKGQFFELPLIFN